MSVILNAVGDFILEAGQPEGYPFEFVQDLLQDGDIRFGNNETVISNHDVPVFQKAFSIRSAESATTHLVKAGFDVLHFANNHCFDFGVTGIEDSLRNFRKANIPSLGVGLTADAARQPVILERNGLRIGFYGAGTGGSAIEQDGRKAYFNDYRAEWIVEDLRALRQKVDVLIFSAHWDAEGIDLPAPEIQHLARQLIDHGVDLILGHHPHIPHGIERYQGDLIVYSLGNFQFRMNYRPELHYSFLFLARLGKRGVEDYELIPLLVGSDSRPYPVQGKEAQTILDFIARVSAPLPDEITEEMFEDSACEVFFLDNMNSWAKRVEEYGESHLMEMFQWFTDPVRCHRFYLLMKKKNWTLFDLNRSLGIYHFPDPLPAPKTIKHKSE